MTTDNRSAPEATGSGGRRSARAFWTVAAGVGVVLAANSTPTPLYVNYQERWGFSATTLTAVFAMYAAGVLVALLLVGGLSDRVGRRPVLLGSLCLLIASYALFLAADSVAWLYVARAVHGLATGVFTGAASAALVDLHPRGDHRTAGLVNSAAMPSGLAVGAAVSGALAQWGPSPLHTPFLVLAGLSLALLVAIALWVPETVPLAPGRWSRVLRLQPLRVPAKTRREFLIAGTGVAVAWAVGGVYLSLGGSLVKELLHSYNPFIAGLVIVSMQGVAGLAQLTWTLRWGAVSDGITSAIGCVALLLGMLAVSGALLAGSTALFFTGSALTGIGFGLAFMGSSRRITQVAPVERRGETLAAFFVVAYLAFSIPAILAGFLSTRVGLTHTFYAFATLTALLAAFTAVRSARLAASPRPAGAAARGGSKPRAEV
ncbi:MFS transporter [Streptomyces sp. V3I7]|uniref:MFS transporter n=1 Tax=Streptomyces sp. V3I7 TaxID=3042278 RepID=UPI002785E939|nr:MFS transporter [Streptomyces sp. V3I7]MDQ0989191.1 MFS family permease [Streptomyces sp. V3I7]